MMRSIFSLCEVLLRLGTRDCYFLSKHCATFVSSFFDGTTRSTFLYYNTTDYTKDFEAARRVGMHAVLLNRYGEEELAQEWKRRGAIVFDDLMDVVWWLGQSDCQLG
jgi:hypothetical protein